MSEKLIQIGFDRYLDLKWANYSLDLFLSNEDEDKNYADLKSFINGEIEGKESARKTSNQLKRLWLRNSDGCQELRSSAKQLFYEQSILNPSIFHFGMAINTSPIFRDTCKILGELSHIQQRFENRTVISRLNESYVNTTSIPRVATRIIQTLVSWGFLKPQKKSYELKEITIEDNAICSWLLSSLIMASSFKEITFRDVNSIPEMLGIRILNARKCLQNSKTLSLKKSITGEEVVYIVV